MLAYTIRFAKLERIFNTVCCVMFKLLSKPLKLLLSQLSKFCQDHISYTSLPAALRAAQTCRYLIYSEADFEVFRPAVATHCPDGGEIWHGVGDHAKLHPIGATTSV